MELPEGFELACVMEREDPRDAFVSNDFSGLEALPAGAIVGTSSLRREAQLRLKFPTLKIVPLRGNLDTRLAKLDRGDMQAIILAAAGLKRLGLASRIRQIIPPDVMLPAVGQGALGIEIRRDGQAIRQALAPLIHEQTFREVRAERAVSRALGGSCQVPLAAYCTTELDKKTLWLRALVAMPDGRQMCQASMHGQDPEALGQLIAQDLRAQGASEILRSLSG
jgi:hydroxymethylbilane synthase